MKNRARFTGFGRGGAYATAASLVLGLTGCQTADVGDHDGHQNVGEAALPVFVNGNFEDGPAGSAPQGWTVTTYLNPGVTVQTPQTKAGLNLGAGGTAATFKLNSATGPETQQDFLLGAGASLRWPKYGNGAAIVNQNVTGRIVNSLKQTMTIAAGDLDANDGLAHVRFTVAPVLENGGHTTAEQPYYYVQLTNITKGNAVLYRDYNASAQPGVPWKNVGINYYTDWQLVDIAPGSAQLAIGDQVELEVIAAACSQGGHRGHVYVDGVGASIPGLFVTATGPASANQGANITYTLTYKNDGTGTALLPNISFTTPPNTTYQSISSGLATCTTPLPNGTGTVSCGLVGLAPGQSGTITITVKIDAAATGTITAGNYQISATGISPLLGPKVYTSVTQNLVYADLGITKTNGVGGVAWSSPVSYTIVASNAGPNTATNAVVTDTLPAQLAGATWTCAGANGGSCATASGSGNIAHQVTLPTGGTATFTVNANVVGGSGTGSLSNTASIAVPPGITEANAVNNSANDTDPIGELRAVTVTKAGSGAGTVTSAPSAISCGSTCTGNFLQGSNVVLTATPDAGSVFTGWSGGCSGTGQCSLTVTNPTAVTATFAKTNGGVCSSAADCGSGNCVDGVCCNTACGGGATNDCQACNVAGSIGTCAPAPTTTVCRAAAGSCDAAETCNGLTTVCPLDGYAPILTTCRPSAGPCDAPDLCTGLSPNCPADAFLSPLTVCRNSAGVCDAAETCTGSSAACPADAFQPSSTTCRASVGLCDVAEQCTGSAAACPADGVAPAATVCRAPAGACDVAETCNGVSNFCPLDAVAPAATVCRASNGICDVAESCNGVTAGCPADGFASAATTCRASNGVCDVAEQCTGSAAACPADGFASSATQCRASNGPCDVAESCTGSAAACPSDGFASAATVCRAQNGVCDVAETCTGSAAACPANGFASSATVCRAQNGVCDAAESCTGSNANCPADGFASAATTCRAANGDCDVAETCTGSGTSCPADAFAPSSTVCRAQNGVCDAAESCTGAAANCPADAFEPTSTVCRTAAGDCDVAESCTGSAGSCPSDIRVAAGTQCRAANGICDVAEACDGGVACPVNGFAAAGTECSDASCDNGSETLAAACTGSGASCPAPVVASCNSYICGEDACLDACQSSSDCASGFFCATDNTCQPKKDPGGVCDNEGQCASASCVDGYCCDTACDGQCEACDVAGQLGTCSPVTGAPHGDRTECATDGSLCGGECNGTDTDACEYPNSGVECRAASCSNGTATLAAGCNGAGACPDEQTQDCGNFVCGPSACLGDCTIDDDCDSGNYCSAGVCVIKIDNGGECTGNNQCDSGICVDGFCCNVACEGQCQACDVEGSEGECSPVIGDPHGGRAPCASDGGVCGGQCDGDDENACAFPGADIECRAAACSDGVATLAASCDGSGACPDETQQTCTPFLCGATACEGDCTLDSDCDAGNYCSAGVCVEKHEPGDLCAGNNECASDFCVDGVCCNVACQGQCQACDVNGSVGTCSPVTGDPHGARDACDTDGSECGGTCNGVNVAACTFPGGAVTCRDPSCEGGVATLEAFCDGAGSCPAAEQQDCGEFVCGATACAGDCEDDSDCSGGNFCSGGTCQPKRAAGESCGADNECGSGFCTDGVCCNVACEGQCQACDVEGSAGECVAVEGEPHGRRPACSGTGACAGSCNGTDTEACAFPGADTECGEASCEDGVATLASTCNGNGACAQAQTETCDPYVCGGDGACADSCTTAADCLEGFICENGACVEVKGGENNGEDDDLGGLAAVGGGCSCRTAGDDSSSSEGLWLAGALAMVLAGRRQRRNRAQVATRY